MAGSLNLVDERDRVGRETFRILLNDAVPATVERIATRTCFGEDAVREGLSQLDAIGRLQFDAQGRVVAIFGLSLLSTKHRMSLRGRDFHTWCAYDSVGIPAALGESAHVSNSCELCHQVIEFDIVEGRVPEMPIVVSWLVQPCASIREEFCPTVNFFCDEAHFVAWAPEGYPRSAFLTLEQAAIEGQKNWGWAATPEQP